MDFYANRSVDCDSFCADCLTGKKRGTDFSKERFCGGILRKNGVDWWGVPHFFC
jgi:hypothetical protein